MFPARFKALQGENIERFIQILDPSNKGRIMMSKLFTLFALQSTPFPSGKQLDSYERNLMSMAQGDGEVSFRDFQEVKFNPDLKNSNFIDLCLVR